MSYKKASAPPPTDSLTVGDSSDSVVGRCHSDSVTRYPPPPTYDDSMEQERFDTCLSEQATEFHRWNNQHHYRQQQPQEQNATIPTFFQSSDRWGGPQSNMLYVDKVIRPELVQLETMPIIAKYPEYANFLKRVRSLNNFKLCLDGLLSSKAIAEAGFFMQRQHEDKVTCYSCGVQLMDWKQTDVPLYEHYGWLRREGKHCPYLSALYQLDSKARTIIDTCKTLFRNEENTAFKKGCEFLDSPFARHGF